MAKYYYDTGVFGYFLFRNDWEHTYSPTKVNGYTSVFCDEELLYAYMKGQFKEWGINHTFVEVSDKLLSVGSLFQQYDMDIKEIRARFLYLIGSLAQNSVDIKGDWLKYKESSAPKPLDGMDWLHLSAAELLGCNAILTTDSGFDYLTKVGKYLRLDKVKKIIIFDNKGKLEKLKEIPID